VAVLSLFPAFPSANALNFAKRNSQVWGTLNEQMISDTVEASTILDFTSLQLDRKSGTKFPFQAGTFRIEFRSKIIEMKPKQRIIA